MDETARILTETTAAPEIQSEAAPAPEIVPAEPPPLPRPPARSTVRRRAVSAPRRTVRPRADALETAVEACIRGLVDELCEWRDEMIAEEVRRLLGRR